MSHGVTRHDYRIHDIEWVIIIKLGEKLDIGPQKNRELKNKIAQNMQWLAWGSLQNLRGNVLVRGQSKGEEKCEAKFRVPKGQESSWYIYISAGDKEPGIVQSPKW